MTWHLGFFENFLIFFIVIEVKLGHDLETWSVVKLEKKRKGLCQLKLKLRIEDTPYVGVSERVKKGYIVFVTDLIASILHCHLFF